MFATISWVIRAFLVGLAIGLLTAPRAGAETRRLLRGLFVTLVEELAEILVLPSEPIELPDRLADRERVATRG